jgi:hypothetical protein
LVTGVVSVLAWGTQHGASLGVGPWLGLVVMLTVSMSFFVVLAWMLSGEVRNFVSGVFGRLRQAH